MQYFHPIARIIDMSHLTVYFSNRVEFLFEKLKKRLFTLGEPFVKRVVVVPSPAMKTWLMIRLANESGIAAGVKITHLENIIQTLPASLELSLCIEAEIRKIAAAEEGDIWKPLLDYLISDQRVIAIAKELAYVFQLYGKYGENMLKEWLETPALEWQQALWKRIYEKYRWPFLSDQKWEPIQLHLFALSHISQKQHEFFTNLPQPPIFYQLSPCQHFWSDLTSQRENAYLQRRLSAKNWAGLEQFLHEGNPLLANFGKLGREMALQLEESESVVEERYFIPSGALQFEPYRAALIGEEEVEDSAALTLLQALQTDLLLLRKPESKIALTEGHSVQIHNAPSPLREVQILHNHLLDLVQREGISPGGMVVMAPNIMEYYPYIRMVFDNSPLKYQINDLSANYQSPLIQSFIFLLKLSQGRWDATTVWQLFEDARFQKKHKMGTEELNLIKHWMEESRILWGENGAHRSEILQRNFCKKEMNDGHTGTWEWAFGRLIEGLAMSNDDALPIVEATEMELLGKWMELMRALRSDLRICTDGTKRNLREWGEYLQKLAENYFSLDALSEADEVLFQQLERFRSMALVEGDFPFSTLLHHLEMGLTHNVTTYREKELNVVRFSSLRAFPSDVVALLGMHEGSFPGTERKSALNLLTKSDYIPAQSDFDRYLFLEVLLAAKKRLLISYQGINSQDGEKQAPSILVSELLNYCDEAYTINGEKHYPIEHPFSPFDYRYFTNDKKWISYSQEHYRLALAHYQKKTPSFSFIPEFKQLNGLQTISCEITVEQIKAFAKNPLRPYFIHTLGIHLKEDRKKLYSEESFELTPLERHQFKNKAFENTLEKVFFKAEKEGRLPFGVFKTLAYEALHNEVSELQAAHRTLRIDQEELFSIELSQKVTAPESEGKNWMVPPLKIACPSGSEVILTGVLTDLCSEGLMVNYKDDRIDAIKAYPLLLLLSCLLKNFDLPVKPQLLFIKSSQTRTPFYHDAEKLLSEYLDYYLQSLQNLSPLIPEFTPDIVRKDPIEFAKTLSQKLSNTHQPLYNQELLWAFRGNELPDLHHWKSVAEKLYSDLLNNWYE